MNKLLAYLENKDNFIGTLYLTRKYYKLSSIFSYDQKYLQNKNNYQIDMELDMQLGSQVVSNELPNCFLDSMPDRWGKNLIDKKYPNKKLSSLDYLVEVNDEVRQGAIRFKNDVNSFLSSGQNNIPKIIDLPKLMDASNSIDKDLDAVKYLLNTGTHSLGGSRPKAIVKDDNVLYIAKFNSSNDSFDVMENEYNTLKKAKEFGINVPDFKMIKVKSDNVLLIKRFDREYDENNVKRIGYISGITALKTTDFKRHDYIEIIDFITKYCKNPSRDIKELFKRIKFTIEVNNTDDHLRNHGFLYKGGGWELSPVFDINQDKNYNIPRVTTINGADTYDDSLKQLNILKKKYSV